MGCRRPPETELTMMKTLLAASAIVLAGTVAALAATPKPIDQFDYWGAFTYEDAKRGKLCYALAVPEAKKPADRDHGDVYFVVSAKAGKSGYEPQVEVGYPLKPDADVSVKVGSKTFPMFANANNAWLKDTKNANALITAMRKGAKMEVSGVSKRGTETTYTYNLRGVTAALKAISNCK